MKNTGGIALAAAALVFAVSAVAFGASVVDAVWTGDEKGVPAGTDGVVAPSGSGVATPPGAMGVEESGESPSDPAGPQGAVGEGPVEGAYPLVSQEEILGAVNQDLFQPDRAAPFERYVLPNQRIGSATAAMDDRRRREPNLRVVGTAVAGDLAIALVQLEDSIPFAVLLGEVVDGYTLAAVTDEGAVLVDENGEFSFPVTEPDRAGSSNSRTRNARGNNARVDEAAQALSERVQQMLQQMGRGQMGRGGFFAPGAEVSIDPARLQQLQRGGQLPPNVVIRTRPGGGGGGQP